MFDVIWGIKHASSYDHVSRSATSKSVTSCWLWEVYSGFSADSDHGDR